MTGNSYGYVRVSTREEAQMTEYEERIAEYAREISPATLIAILKNYDKLVREKSGIADYPEYPFWELCCAGGKSDEPKITGIEQLVDREVEK